MNTGIIATRYARALLRYAELNGVEEKVFSQARSIEKAFDKIPEFHRLVNDAMGISAYEKIAVIASAVGEEGLLPELASFFRLVIKGGRAPEIRYIIHSYLEMYLKSKNIILAKLTVAAPSPGLEDKLREIVRDRAGAELIFETRIDPKLIGGFVVILNDVKVDASVARQLDTILNQFIEKNRRIV